MSHDLTITPSAQAMHLLCCMSVSLHQAIYSDRERAVKHVPLKHCMTSQFDLLNPQDPGLLLLAKLSGKDRFERFRTIDYIRDELREPLVEAAPNFPWMQDHLTALLQLKSKSEGWLHLDSLWEHMTGTSLSHELNHLPATLFLNPSEDYTGGCKYFLHPMWYEDAGDLDEDEDTFLLHSLPVVLVSNDLTALLEKIQDHARSCQQVLIEAGLAKHADHSVIHICVGQRDRIMSQLLPDIRDESQSPIELDLADMQIHAQAKTCLTAIANAFGHEVAARYAAPCLEQDLNL